MKPVIKKNVYDGIAKIVEEINAKSHKEVINDRNYRKIYSIMNNYEKKYQEIIIDCIIDSVELTDIYKTIELSENDDTPMPNDELMDLVDEIENSTNEVFMLSDQKVIEAEPVDVTIGEEDSSDDSVEEDPIESEYTNTENVEHTKTSKNLYALLENSTDRFKTMCDFFRNVDYGFNYQKKIKETLIKEYDEFNNGESKVKLLGYKATNPVIWTELPYMITAYRTVHNC